MSPARMAQADPVYGRIWRSVPRSIDPALREDIMSEIYLAIREGRLHPRDIAVSARVYINGAFAAFASRWGAVSIDAIMPGTDDLRIIDTIEDPQALEAFDRIEIRSRAAPDACERPAVSPCRRAHIAGNLLNRRIR